MIKAGRADTWLLPKLASTLSLLRRVAVRTKGRGLCFLPFAEGTGALKPQAGRFFRCAASVLWADLSKKLPQRLEPGQ